MIGRSLLALISLATPSAAEPLRIGVAVGFAPFVTYDANGMLEGIDADMIDHLCTAHWDACVVQPMDFKDMIPAVRTGEVDMIIGGFAITPARQAMVDMTCSYTPPITSLGTFIGKARQIDVPTARIGVIEASFHAYGLEEAGLAAAMFPNTAQAVQAMQRGQIDTYFGRMTDWDAASASVGGLSAVYIQDYLDLPSTSNVIGLAPGNDDLRLTLNSIIADLARDGTLDAWNAQWLMRDGTADTSNCNAIQHQS